MYMYISPSLTFLTWICKNQSLKMFDFLPVFVILLQIFVVLCNGKNIRGGPFSQNFLSVTANKYGHRELRIAYNHVLVLETSAFWNTEDEITLRQVINGKRSVQFVYQNKHLTDCENSNKSKFILHFVDEFMKGTRHLRKMNNTDPFQVYSSTNLLTSTGAYRHVESKSMLKKFRHFVDFKKQAYMCRLFHQKNFRETLSHSVSEQRNNSHTIAPVSPISQRNEIDYGSNENLSSKKHRVKRDTSSSRSKRDLFSGWLIFPGTKWCGTGDIAENYDDLGYDESTDMCCRKHDNCPHLIHRFTWKYNMFNYHLHTMSLCVCDNRFRKCLKKSKSPTASMVGKIYFNVIGPQCFKIKRKKTCKKRHWWGSCKKYRGEIFAYPKDQKPF